MKASEVQAQEEGNHSDPLERSSPNKLNPEINMNGIRDNKGENLTPDTPQKSETLTNEASSNNEQNNDEHTSYAGYAIPGLQSMKTALINAAKSVMPRSISGLMSTHAETTQTNRDNTPPNTKEKG